MEYDSIAEQLAHSGLAARGGFYPGLEDAAPLSAATIILVGNIDADFWAHFQAGRRDEANPLDSWTKRVVDRVAAKAGGWAVYPSDGPPYFPFQRWAQRCEPVFPSPIGLIMHPDYGLWHAYRAAICLHRQIDLPVKQTRDNPCDTCRDRPCLSTCPVEAFSPGNYNVSVCADHVRTDAGKDCREDGCRARRACPVGGQERYAPSQAAFHMASFLAARDR